MRFLFLGDIVGKPGMLAVEHSIARIKTEWSLDAIVVNAENASDGSGLMPDQYRRLISAGVDGITMGDHIYRRREIIETLKRSADIVKPANYPPKASGRCHMTLKTSRGMLGVISLIGRVFIDVAADSIYDAVDREIEALKGVADSILIDIHAEATSEKQAIARYVDGRVTAVLGTHTHVPTADAQVLPGGTAFQCDVGMTGPYESVIGRDVKSILKVATTGEPTRYHVATDGVQLCGAIVETESKSMTAKSIESFRYSPDQAMG